jgi:hypothetical protein
MLQRMRIRILLTRTKFSSGSRRPPASSYPVGSSPPFQSELSHLENCSRARRSFSVSSRDVWAQRFAASRRKNHLLGKSSPPRSRAGEHHAGGRSRWPFARTCWRHEHLRSRQGRDSRIGHHNDVALRREALGTIVSAWKSRSAESRRPGCVNRRTFPRRGRRRQGGPRAAGCAVLYEDSKKDN